MAFFGLLCLSVLPTAAFAQSKGVVVFAAASLKNALDDVNRAWERETGKTATLVYAASNLLAKQIEAGAPADLFVSADLDWMDYSASRNLIRPQERINLLGNTLVLIAPKDSPVETMGGANLDLATRLGSGRLAMGNVDAVPAGKYGKAALEHLGEWNGVKDKVAQAESVSAALLLVSRGEAAFGIVYGTDAASDPNVKIVSVFPANTYPPIIYPAALTADSKHPDAAAFLAFMRSDTARKLFEGQGFVVLNQPVPRS
nr:molybdate ABC transporter substrate-binding protein [Microvirga antarctica]